MLLPTRISSALVLVLVASTALGFAPRMKVPVLRVALAAAQVSSSSRNLIASSDTRDDDAKVRTGALAVSHVEPPEIVSDEAKLRLAEPENLRLSVAEPFVRPLKLPRATYDRSDPLVPYSLPS